jgi:hypothetical protein
MSHPMKKLDFGMWEIVLAHGPAGKPVIPHDTKVKVRMFDGVIA